ncbi:MAG: glutaminyl-peptide cyclotransferase [Candidatus Pelagadaptatus aseana]|uniref:glutaminyl-peptide cyclotransferase n=1 Tax=Candidatus Pelagadaptatus aseana TaxID=3120508 RepID=UPI0039B29522
MAVYHTALAMHYRLIPTLFLLALCQLPLIAAAQPLGPQLPYKVLQKLPHDPQLFTQGLVIEDNTLWESSGLYGRSLLQRRDKQQVRALTQFRYPAHEFAEGIALMGDYLYGLTWKSGRVYRWRKHSLELDRTYRIHGEGWGLSLWREDLAISNGSDTITFYHPETLSPKRSIQIRAEGEPVTRLNDLTATSNHLWANIWHNHQVIQIDPDTGEVTAHLNLRKLVDENRSYQNEAVLNGIAWDNSSNTLWVTGKYWQHLYQLELLPGSGKIQR